MSAASQHKKRRFEISRKVNRIAPSGIRRFFDILADREDVISLGVGEPDYATPWNIRESAIQSLEQGYTMYTSNSGMPELRQEISRYIKENHGLEYDPVNEILITVGVSEGLDLSMRAILNTHDEVIIPEPHYVSYPACVTLAGGVPVMVPTREENDFEITAREIESQITPKTKAILLGYPSNPTGAVLGAAEMKRIAALAEKHNIIVISDEIYEKLVYGEPHQLFATLPGMRESSIMLGGFSKAYAMTGWRIAYACANRQFIGAMTKIHQHTMLCAPIMAQKAAIEALRNGDESAAEMVEEYDRRRKLMVKGLNDIGLSCFEPRGAFYAFPSIKVTGMTSDEFAEKLLVEENVACVAGTAFGQCGEGYVRCCYAISTENIIEALKRMKRFVAKYRQDR